MEDLVRYRAMESLCRQSAVFRPLESWRLLAEAEMWHHKALEEITSRSIECNGVPPTGALAQSASLPNPRERSFSLCLSVLRTKLSAFAQAPRCWVVMPRSRTPWPNAG